jgi:hypothetical protein
MGKKPLSSAVVALLLSVVVTLLAGLVSLGSAPAMRLRAKRDPPRPSRGLGGVS